MDGAFFSAGAAGETGASLAGWAFASVFGVVLGSALASAADQRTVDGQADDQQYPDDPQDPQGAGPQDQDD